MATKEEVMAYVEDHEFHTKCLALNSISFGKVIDFDKELGVILLDVKTQHGPIDLRATWEDVDYE